MHNPERKACELKHLEWKQWDVLCAWLLHGQRLLLLILNAKSAFRRT